MGICGRCLTTYNRNAYGRGFKYCARCRLFINVVDIMCPCCNREIKAYKNWDGKKFKELGWSITIDGVETI